MCKVTIIEPKISKKENEKNLKRLEEVLQKVALQIVQSTNEEVEENVIPKSYGITLIK